MIPRRQTPVADGFRAPDGLRPWKIVLAVGALLLGAAPASAAGGLLDLLLGWPHDVQVITTTDLTPAGKLMRPASPENPVYYVAVSVGYRDLGGYIAGDKLPAPKDMIRTVAHVLARQGYLPADNQHPPSQCIVFGWGSLYRITIPNEFSLNLPDVQLNRRAMMRFLGGNKLGLASDRPDPWLDDTLLPGLTRFNPDAVAIAEVSGDDLYAIVLSGYTFPSPQPHKPQLLWRTKIGSPARGLVMADTLPTMMTIAGPYVARDTKRPVWVNASDKFKPNIRIGDLKVEEYLDSGNAPIFDAKALTKPAKPKSP